MWNAIDSACGGKRLDEANRFDAERSKVDYFASFNCASNSGSGVRLR